MKRILCPILCILAGCAGSPNGEAGGKPPEPGPEPVQDRPAGLRVEDLEVGAGEEAKPGDTVVVHYTGWLTNGKKFDSSRDRNEPFTFTIGRSSVIQGWHQGIPGMRVGGKRRLTIPPELGYGAAGYPGVIPPNATLVFEVELLSIRK